MKKKTSRGNAEENKSEAKTLPRRQYDKLVCECEMRIQKQMWTVPKKKKKQKETFC